MYPTRGLTRRLTVVAATGALTAGLVAPAQADSPGDRSTWAPATASVRPDDRADRTRVALVAIASGHGSRGPVTVSVRPDDRADRTGPPTSAAAPVTRADAGDPFEPGDALGIALVVTAIGLGVGAMVYTQRFGSA
jgi:hypothetical protein